MAGASLALPLLAFATQQMNWQELGFTVHPSDDPFFGLEFEQKKQLEIVLKVVRLEKEGAEIEAELVRQEAEARLLLQQNGLNADQLIEKERSFFEKLATQRSGVRRELNDRDIRIAGYMLPLEFDASGKVTEFLLLPYAGACIHTPPPPPNQIIHAITDQGFSADQLFTPVWVSGMLKIEMHRQQVGLSDGQSEFGVAYTLIGSTVERYD